jgi:hypothetical protein
VFAITELLQVSTHLLLPTGNGNGQGEDERKRQLYAWAEGVLDQLSYAARVAQARSLDELRRITLDADSADVALAIREALHPASGQPRAIYFAGLREGALKQILRNRLAESKKQRDKELQSRTYNKSRIQNCPKNRRWGNYGVISMNFYRPSSPRCAGSERPAVASHPPALAVRVVRVSRASFSSVALVRHGDRSWTGKPVVKLK